jgi:8-oxo-dGTP diphosphatase
MKLVRTVFDKSWIPYKCRVEYYLDSSARLFEAPVTTVHGFFVEEEKILLVRHKKRGWEVPGGHVELGEAYEDAMRRELREEAQMECGELNSLGYLKKTALEAVPENCSYPHPLSYCLFFMAPISAKGRFSGDDSIIESKFFSFKEASDFPWIKSYIDYYREFLRIISFSLEGL